MTTTEVALDFRPIAGSLGAEARGIDLAGPLSEDCIEEIETGLARFGVLLFTGQHLDVDGHAALARALGTPKLPPPYIPSLADLGHPEICEISTDNQLAYSADRWHTDVTWESAPPKYSILHMQIAPAAGGDTMWSSQYLAYETLSPGMQDFLQTLTARHQHPIDSQKGADHPMVCRHPRTGRKALFCNSTFTAAINGLSENESTALLSMLYTHAARPEFICRWRWTDGDVAIWDNHFVQHYALNDFGAARRKIHRIEIQGEPPIPAAPTVTVTA